MSYKSTILKSKWTKTKWLLKDPGTKEYIPTTMQFSRVNLIRMLSQYSTVYFKPELGSGGHHIIRIKKREGRGYLYQYNSVITHCSSLDELYTALNKKAQKMSYLLQKGIQLEKVDGRPFDIRVMVQKSRGGVWRTTGLFTKIGAPGTVATNYHQGGKLELLETTLIRAGYSDSVVTGMSKVLKKLGKAVGTIFDMNLDGFQELGLDVALDHQGELWILEVNTKPQIQPLKELEDKSYYRNILSKAKQYGRTK